MKLLNIELQNIGPYENSFIDLSTTPIKNLILICGENGAGKTTLLKSIKLGLFGSYLYGLKQNSRSNTYVSEIKSIVRNKCNIGSISLKFSIIENYLETIYEIKREWVLSPTFKETVMLKINDLLMSEDEFLNKVEYINRYFNPKLIDSVMFDGEKILGYIDTDSFDEYIKENITYVYGLNYYIDLISDLEKYIKNEESNGELSADQIYLNELIEKHKLMKKEVSMLQDKEKSLRDLKEKKEFERDMKLQEFQALGGLNSDESKELSKYFKKLDVRKKEQNKIMKDFFENQLLYVLNTSTLFDVEKQIEIEKPRRYNGYLSEILESKQLSKEDVETLRAIQNKFTNNVNEILSLNRNEEKQFIDLNVKIENANKDYDKIIHTQLVDENVLSNLRKKISLSKRKESNEVLEIILKLDNECNELLDELAQTLGSIQEKNDEIENVYLKIQDIKETVYKESKRSNSFVLANKYRDVCKQYYETELNGIVNKISTMVTKLLNETYRKKNYITKVKISSDFHITAYYENEIKNLKQLSAGEKQIFVTAVIVAIVKCSNRNIPIVFDTPAGRLDQEHMTKFYDAIMSRSGSQVIIMPTSKEINDKVINHISKSISKCYTLNYQENRITEVLKNRIFERKWN